MEFKEAITRVEDSKSTASVVDDMLVLTTKRYDKFTGKLSEPIKQYLSIPELEARKTSLERKLQTVNALLSLVSEKK
jgi:hypothetical protein